MNDSITVPQGGKKTINVRLTVTPEQQKVVDELAARNAVNNNNLSPGEIINTTPMGCNISSKEKPAVAEEPTPGGQSKCRNNVNVTIRENLNRHQSVRHRERSHHFAKPRFHSVRLPNQHGAHHQQQNLECRGCRDPLPEVIRDCGASPMRHRKKWRERNCSSFHRPDLCQLIQANMEKNNVYPCCRGEPLTAHHVKGHSRPPSPPLCTHNHLIDPNCPILPLLNNDNSICKEKQGNSPHKCPSRSVKFSEFSPGAKFLKSCRRHGHHRSRSHDLSENQFQYHPMTADNRDSPKGSSPGNGISQRCNNYQYHCSHEERLEISTRCVLNSTNLPPPQQSSPRTKNTNTNNNKNIFLNKLSPGTTPHQLKHRNREEEHARAMAQVINWLERENIGDKNTSSPKPFLDFQHQHHFRQIPSSPPIGKKHEHHHHVHEHIHHHYHHHFGKETPIIV